MTTVQVPDDLAVLARETAAKENQSLDQFVAGLLLAQLDAKTKFAALKERAARGDGRTLRKVLDAVPSAPPLPGDEI